MRAAINGIELEYETFGDSDDPTLVLIAGVGAQLVWFHPELCEGFVDRGFHVVRFDNRDVGRSTWVDTDVDAAEAIGRTLAGEAVDAPYDLDDMAADVLGLCDHLDLDRPCLFGVSMGGMIAQQAAIRAPDRVGALASVMSTTGDPDVGQPTPAAVSALLAASPAERDLYVARAVEKGEVLAGDGGEVDLDWVAERAGLAFDRGVNPDATSRHLLAILVSPPRSAGLRALDVPALVIHGEQDPLVTVSGGERTAECLRDSEFLRLDGMGHDLPRYYWATVIHHVVALAARAG
ncbi:MAG TPA: alpha/beta hydrolase [Acidimicrobiales bacterium]